MDNNKHPHYDLIVEWAKDTSKQLQILAGDNAFCDCIIGTVIDNPKLPVRFKPREFIKGHWYPCLHEGRRFICCFDGAVLLEPINKGYKAISVTWDTYSCCGLKIGKSLGEIKFNE